KLLGWAMARSWAGMFGDRRQAGRTRRDLAAEIRAGCRNWQLPALPVRRSARCRRATLSSPIEPSLSPRRKRPYRRLRQSFCWGRSTDERRNESRDGRPRLVRRLQMRRVPAIGEQAGFGIAAGLAGDGAELGLGAV